MNKNHKHISLVVGTRPEAIKMRHLVRCLNSSSLCSVEVLCTGQHTKIVQEELSEFAHLLRCLPVRLSKEASHAGKLACMIYDLDIRLRKSKPHMLVVQGDTLSTLAGSLAAFYNRIPIAHVEAGLRSHDRRRPFPEEVNRRIASLATDLYFPPTREAALNLSREGVDNSKIFVAGNTVVDALRELTPAIFEASPIPGADVVVTMHRHEIRGDIFAGACNALLEAAKKFPGKKFVMVRHPNPAVQRDVPGHLSSAENFCILDPLSHGDFIRLIRDAELVVTDSGGVQEETAVLGIPALVLREVTERPEGIRLGLSRLVGLEPSAILREITKALENGSGKRPGDIFNHCLGDGRASERIARVILDYVDEKSPFADNTEFVSSFCAP